MGALQYYRAFAEIYVEDLWVAPHHRKKGIGRALMRHLEARHKGQGYNNINLVTSHFQAPGFYKKCGFSVEFERLNPKNPKLSKTFFIKFFDDVTQERGLLLDA